MTAAYRIGSNDLYSVLSPKLLNPRSLNEPIPPNTYAVAADATTCGARREYPPGGKMSGC